MTLPRLTRAQLRCVSEPKYEIVDHGVCNLQYFIPPSLYFSGWTDRIIGIGSSAFEALEDALDEASFNMYDVSHIKNELPEEEHELAEDCYYYVTLLLG